MCNGPNDAYCITNILTRKQFGTPLTEIAVLILCISHRPPNFFEPFRQHRRGQTTTFVLDCVESLCPFREEPKEMENPFGPENSCCECYVFVFKYIPNKYSSIITFTMFIMVSHHSPVLSGHPPTRGREDWQGWSSCRQYQRNERKYRRSDRSTGNRGGIRIHS